MKFAILILTACFLFSQPTYKVDFGKDKMGENWKIINDGVMGGLSKGQVTFNDNALTFKGKVSLANNGGFTSFKSPFESIDLSEFEKVRMRVRGQGQTYGLTLEVERIWYMPYFKKKFTPKSDDWEILEFSLADFEQYRIGRTTGKMLTKKELENILRVGIITDEKREGSFELEIDYIEFL
ncbi:MAG: CIA30 family protein [Bacteroidota bacterium]